MPSTLESLLSGVSTAGEYADKLTGGRALRGLAAGRPRELASVLPFSDTLGLTDPHQQTSGKQVLGAWGLPESTLGGAAVEMLLNPLALVGGIGAAAKAPTALRALGAFGKEVSGLGALESAGRGLASAGRGLKSFATAPSESPGLVNLLTGEAGAVRSPITTPISQADVAGLLSSTRNPLGRLGVLAGHSPAELVTDPESLLRKFGPPRPPKEGKEFALFDPGFTQFSSKGPIEVPGEIYPNLNWGFWRDNPTMMAHLRALEAQGKNQPILHPDLIGVHELGHAFHQKALEAAEKKSGLGPAELLGATEPGAYSWTPKGRELAAIQKHLGPYAAQDPNELVAEAFAKQVLGQTNLPAPIQRLYNRFVGPDPNALPPQFWGAIKNFLASESGAIPIPGTGPYRPQDIQRVTGKLPIHLTPEAGGEAYRAWAQGLAPEEQEAIKAFSSSPQVAISQALRGGHTYTEGGHPLDVFAEPASLRTPIPGVPELRSPAVVEREIRPYLDAALSRAAAPEHLMTYRRAGQWGAMTPENAARFVGQTVSDPSYLSTTATPWGPYYGRNADPKDMLLDILVPKGASAADISSLTRHPDERELLLGRGYPAHVHDVRQVPTRQIQGISYRLDPSGRPLPRPGSTRDVLHTPEAADIFYSQIAKPGVFGEAVVPEALLQPGWQDLIRAAPERTQTQALLELLAPPLAPHAPAVERMPPQEMWQQIARALKTSPPPRPGGIPDWLGRSIRQGAKQGVYPEPGLLEELRGMGVNLPDLFASRPRGTPPALPGLWERLLGRLGRGG